MQKETMTSEEVDRAWAQWCRDVERFLAWSDGAKTDEDTSVAQQATKIVIPRPHKCVSIG